MRTTDLRLAQHIERTFKFKWLIQGRRKVRSAPVIDILAARGIQVVDAKEILSPPFQRPPDSFVISRPEEEPVVEKKTPCYVFHDKYSPPAGLAQIQHLTNSVVRSTLPESLLNQVRENSAEEDSKVQEAILHAHVLDSHQEKLPRIYDVVNRPGWSFPLEYGMTVRRKNKNMTYQLLLLMEQLFPEAAKRRIVENSKIKVNLKHSGKLIQMNHAASFMLSSATPLSPPGGEAEIVGTEEELIPQIYPLSPFLHCKKRFNYTDEDYDSVATSGLYPHTVFIHMNMPRMPHSEDCFNGITLVKAFSHAAAYAKLWCKVDNGILEKPLTVQIVHTNGKKYHVGVFQLNTLDLTGRRKNIFWHIPMESLFDKCSFKAAEATLEGYNPKVFSLLKALHSQ